MQSFFFCFHELSQLALKLPHYETLYFIGQLFVLSGISLAVKVIGRLLMWLAKWRLPWIWRRWVLFGLFRYLIGVILTRVASNMEGKDENSCFFKLGEERVQSIHTLFKYFCYHLQRGQWELSEACIDQLRTEGDVIGINITDILHDVIQFPFGYRYVINTPW